MDAALILFLVGMLATILCLAGICMLEHKHLLETRLASLVFFGAALSGMSCITGLVMLMGTDIST